jgi:hypothetical protein
MVGDPWQHLPPDAPQVTRPGRHHAYVARCIIIHLRTAAGAASDVSKPGSMRYNFAYWRLHTMLVSLEERRSQSVLHIHMHQA